MISKAAAEINSRLHKYWRRIRWEIQREYDKCQESCDKTTKWLGLGVGLSIGLAVIVGLIINKWYN